MLTAVAVCCTCADNRTRADGGNGDAVESCIGDLSQARSGCDVWAFWVYEADLASSVAVW